MHTDQIRNNAIIAHMVLGKTMLMEVTPGNVRLRKRDFKA